MGYIFIHFLMGKLMAPAGRPRTFDKQAALQRAMYVFWDKGYEGTTMGDLIDSIGVKGPSVYAAFGNKDAIFLEALNAYKEMIEQGPLKALESETDVFVAISKLLKESAWLSRNPDTPNGCLIMTSAINSTPEHSHIVEEVKSLRQQYKNLLIERFRKAVEIGQLKSTVDVEELAEFYLMVINGLAMRSKDGSSMENLKNTIDLALIPLKMNMTL